MWIREFCCQFMSSKEYSRYWRSSMGPLIADTCDVIWSLSPQISDGGTLIITHRDMMSLHENYLRRIFKCVISVDSLIETV